MRQTRLDDLHRLEASDLPLADEENGTHAALAQESDDFVVRELIQVRRPIGVR